MLKNSHETLDLNVCWSKQLNQLVNALYVCSFAACWLNDLSEKYQWLLGGLVVVFFMIRYRRKRSSPYFLRYTASVGWALSLDGTDYREIQILDGTVITHYAILLYFKTKKKLSQSILIMRDSVSVNDYRRLIVRLKLSRQVVAR